MCVGLCSKASRHWPFHLKYSRDPLFTFLQCAVLPIDLDPFTPRAGSLTFSPLRSSYKLGLQKVLLLLSDSSLVRISPRLVYIGSVECYVPSLKYAAPHSVTYLIRLPGTYLSLPHVPFTLLPPNISCVSASALSCPAQLFIAELYFSFPSSHLFILASFGKPSEVLRTHTLVSTTASQLELRDCVHHPWSV